MDFESIKTWVMANKLLSAGVGVLAVGAIAYMLTRVQSGKRISSGLSGIGRPKALRKSKQDKAVKLIGLT